MFTKLELKLMPNFSFQSKNIIILFKSFVLGGAEKQGLYLANYLQNKKGCNVYIYSYLKSPNSKLFYLECKKYQLINLFIVPNPLSASGSFKYLKRRIKIALFGFNLRKHRPDIIIPYLNPPSIIASLCYKIAGAKFTFWHHRGPDYYRYDNLEKFAATKTPLFIANSPNGRQELLQILKVPEDKTCFLPNFSTIDSINTNKNIDVLNDLKGKIVIGMLAHFRVEKMQNILLEVFYELTQKYPDICLVLAGTIYRDDNELDYYDSLKSFITAHFLEDKVFILHDLSAESLLPYLDIGVLISLNEGMPNVIMEYMTYNLPILCTKHAGCVSLLGEAYPFYIDNNQDIGAVKNKLELLIKNEKLRNQIGEENRMRIQNNFSIESYLDKLEEIINCNG